MILQPWAHPTSAGLTLRGWHSSPSGKPVLHFFHGNGFCTLVYEPVLSALAADFDLWLTDLQGHGQSDRGDKFLGWRENAFLANETVAASHAVFGDARRFAAGHSFGGVLSTYLLTAQPMLFNRAVLLDPVLFTPVMIATMALAGLTGLPSPGDFAGRARKRRQSWPTREAAYKDFYGRGIFRGWSAAALQAYVTHALQESETGVELRCHRELEAEVFASYPKGLWANLRRVRTPTSVIYGKHSYPFVAKSAQRLRRMNKHVVTQAVPGGHCFMQEFPDDTAQRVRDYLLT